MPASVRQQVPDHAGSARARSGARILVDQLVRHGVERLACVPGESYLGVLDALLDTSVDVVSCRQEGGAAMMAEAWGKATGAPGVCFVTRGPGATNASAGVHIAHQDSTPMVLFVGQVTRAARGRDAWQEIDVAGVFGALAKGAAEARSAAELPALVAWAFHLACADRPGPVVVGLAADILNESAIVADAEPLPCAEPQPRRAAMARLEALLAGAGAPIALLGGSRWDEEARRRFGAFAERFDLPVATSYRRLTLFDPDHRCYAGDLGLGADPALTARFRDADLALVVGARLNEITTQGYTLFEGWKGRLVHVHPSRRELGRIWRPELAIRASPKAFCAALDQLTPAPCFSRESATRAAHGAWERWSKTPTAQPGAVNLARIMLALSERLGPGGLVCNGAGAYAAWIHRFFRFRRLGAHVAPVSASMGYGVPAAVAMKRLHPDRIVVAMSGDADFLMNGQEFATAVQYGMAIVCIVFDNGMHGAIRMHQERHFPGRIAATTLINPDFAAYARAFGGHGETVETTEGFMPAFERALASRRPSIVHVRYDPDGVTPTSTLAGLRAQARATRGSDQPPACAHSQ